MKIQIGKDFPAYFQPAYPEEFELFHHFETTAGIPNVLFAITTWKENGKPNVCFHGWSCFHGDKTAFFAVMGNLYQHTHTYQNIRPGPSPHHPCPGHSGGVSHNGVQAAQHAGSQRRRHYRNGDRTGAAHLRGGGLCPGIWTPVRKRRLYAAGTRASEPCHWRAGTIRHCHSARGKAGLNSIRICFYMYL